jgi:hypothetical protein
MNWGMPWSGIGVGKIVRSLQRDPRRGVARIKAVVRPFEVRAGRKSYQEIHNEHALSSGG